VGEECKGYFCAEYNRTINFQFSLKQLKGEMGGKRRRRMQVIYALVHHLPQSKRMFAELRVLRIHIYLKLLFRGFDVENFIIA
jgi:hypothetical protein